MTEMDKLQPMLPPRYRFTWHTTDSYYECAWNGSRIYLRGMNEDRGESARGSASHIVVADEFGTWKEPHYIVNEVLRPQLLTTNGKLIIVGTPPRNLSHPYYKIKDQYISHGLFIQRKIEDQELVTWEQVEKIAYDMGGWESPAVKRELLCEKVIDTNFSIIPEWKNEYVKEVPQDEFFKFYLKYVSLDIGVRDFTVGLLAYYDFKKATLIVLDEVVLNGPDMTTDKLAGRIREKETTYFGVQWEKYTKDARERYRAIHPPHFRMRRVSDVDLLLVNDMSTIEGLYFEPTDKGYLEEMVNEVRIWVNAGRITVHPRCAALIDCLKLGQWDENRKAWERSEALGHFDALAALMYLVRNVDPRTNPIPFEYGREEDNWWLIEEKKKTNTDQLKKMLGIKRPSIMRGT